MSVRGYKWRDSVSESCSLIFGCSMRFIQSMDLGTADPHELMSRPCDLWVTLEYLQLVPTLRTRLCRDA